MKTASSEYVKSMKQPLRNRGYMRAIIINSSLLTSAAVTSDGIYYSDNDIFDAEYDAKTYATCEQDLSKVNGTMYFAPTEDSGEDYFNSGYVSEDIDGSLEVRLNTTSGVLTLDKIIIIFADPAPIKVDIKCYIAAGSSMIYVTHTVAVNNNVAVLEKHYNYVSVTITPVAWKENNQTIQIASYFQYVQAKDSNCYIGIDYAYAVNMYAHYNTVTYGENYMKMNNFLSGYDFDAGICFSFNFRLSDIPYIYLADGSLPFGPQEWFARQAFFEMYNDNGNSLAIQLGYYRYSTIIYLANSQNNRQYTLSTMVPYGTTDNIFDYTWHKCILRFSVKGIQMIIDDVTVTFNSNILKSFLETFVNDKTTTISFGEGCNPTEYVAGQSYTTAYSDGDYVTVGVRDPKDMWIQPLHAWSGTAEEEPEYDTGTPRRLRVSSVMSGDVTLLDNNDITSFSLTENVSPTSESLPSHDISLGISNYDNTYDLEDEENDVYKFKTGKEINVTHGYDIDGDGYIEWLAPLKYYLSEFSLSETELTLKGTDVYNTGLDNKYYYGKWYASGSSSAPTLYDLAELVVSDAGVIKYALDESLKNTRCYNPMPVVTHKEALQLIANAGCCLIHQNANGYIEITGDAGDTGYEITRNYGMSGTPTLTLEDKIKQIDVTYTEYTIPTFLKQETLEYTATVTPDNSGTQQTIKVEISGSLVEIEDVSYVFNESYGKMTEITWYKGAYANRSIIFTPSTSGGSVTITFTVTVREYPKITSMDANYGDVYKIFNFSSPTYIKAASFYWAESSGSGIISSSLDTRLPYYAKIYLYNGARYTGDGQSVVLYGGEYEATEKTYTVTLNDEGETVTFNNPLISTKAQAKAVADMLKSYYQNRITYAVDFRGDPILECGDIVTIETKNGDLKQIQIEKNELSFSGAWSGKITGRRC